MSPPGPLHECEVPGNQIKVEASGMAGESGMKSLASQV